MSPLENERCKEKINGENINLVQKQLNSQIFENLKNQKFKKRSKSVFRGPILSP